MAIESKNLLVWVKAMSRGQALPLDASEIHGSLAEAELYASSPIAYAGQTIKALLDDGKYHEYMLQPSEGGYVLEEVGAVNESDLKQYVVVDTALPTEGQQQGVVYIETTGNTGSIWTGSDWVKVFSNVDSAIDEINADIDDINSALAEKAPLANPAFTGAVTVDGNDIAMKDYVDGLFAQLSEKSTAPGVVSSTEPIPVDYKGGETFRVAEAGVYAGRNCEVGDLIIAINDYVEGSASDDDFIVLQANIDGAVTSTADVTTVGEIVVFDSVTGKVIKGSGVEIASLNDAIAKAHEHANKEILDTYDKTQDELLAAAKTEAEGLVDALEGTVNSALEGKADKATSLEGYGITDAYTKTEIDASLQIITDNLNTKITGAEADEKIATAKAETLEEAAAAASAALEERVGAIPADTSIKAYVDTAVGTGGTASAEAIAQAKQEAIDTSKEYTDSQLAIVEF